MERLALDRFATPWLRYQHVARYRWACQWAPGAVVLDAACGSLYGSRLLQQAGARRVVALDRSPDAFEEGERAGNLSGLSAALADVAQLPLPSSTIDLYLSFETIEHVRPDAEVLGEAWRVLKPGGRFVCSTPNRDLLSPGNRLDDTPLNPYHVREYSIGEFVELMSGEFEQIELFAQTSFSAGHRRALAVAGRISNRLAVRWHQIRNLTSWPVQSEARHLPVPLETLEASHEACEVVIAVGTKQRT